MTFIIIVIIFILAIPLFSIYLKKKDEREKAEVTRKIQHNSETLLNSGFAKLVSDKLEEIFKKDIDKTIELLFNPDNPTSIDTYNSIGVHSDRITVYKDYCDGDIVTIGEIFYKNLGYAPLSEDQVTALRFALSKCSDAWDAEMKYSSYHKSWYTTITRNKQYWENYVRKECDRRDPLNGKPLIKL